MNNDVEVEEDNRGGEEQQLPAIESLDDYVRRYGIESANGKRFPIQFHSYKVFILYNK